MSTIITFINKWRNWGTAVADKAELRYKHKQSCCIIINNSTDEEQYILENIHILRANIRYNRSRQSFLKIKFLGNIYLYIYWWFSVGLGTHESLSWNNSVSNRCLPTSQFPKTHSILFTFISHLPPLCHLILCAHLYVHVCVSVLMGAGWDAGRESRSSQVWFPSGSLKNWWFNTIFYSWF